MDVCNLEDDECCICYNRTSNRVNPCKHIICKCCAERWYSVKKDIRCPVCKQNMCSFTENISKRSDIVLFAKQNHEFGITLKTDTNGVLVKLSDKKNATCGLKTNTIITHVNEIPVDNHQIVFKIMEVSRQNNMCVHLRIYKPPKEKRRWPKLFNFNFRLKPR